MKFLRKISLFLATVPALVQASPFETLANWFQKADQKYEAQKYYFGKQAGLNQKQTNLVSGSVYTLMTAAFAKKLAKNISHRKLNKVALFGTGAGLFALYHDFKQAAK